MRRTALAAALIPCALLLTACGSTGASSSPASGAGPNAGLTETQLKNRLGTALASATAVHFKGTMSGSGSDVSMDLQINRDGTAEGSIVSDGMTIPLSVIGGVDYIDVTSSFASAVRSELGTAGAAIASKIVVGKWISSKSSVGASLTSGFGSMTDFTAMTKDLAATSGGTFSYLGTSTAQGRPVAQYQDLSTSGGTTSTATMDIPLSGSPLPIEEDAGSQGSMAFAWNQPTKVTAPAAADIISLP